MYLSVTINKLKYYWYEIMMMIISMHITYLYAPLLRSENLQTSKPYFSWVLSLECHKSVKKLNRINIVSHTKKVILRGFDPFSMRHASRNIFNFSEQETGYIYIFGVTLTAWLCTQQGHKRLFVQNCVYPSFFTFIIIILHMCHLNVSYYFHLLILGHQLSTLLNSNTVNKK